jgi:hypothetical protein
VGGCTKNVLTAFSELSTEQRREAGIREIATVEPFLNRLLKRNSKQNQGFPPWDSRISNFIWRRSFYYYVFVQYQYA